MTSLSVAESPLAALLSPGDPPWSLRTAALGFFAVVVTLHTLWDRLSSFATSLSADHSVYYVVLRNPGLRGAPPWRGGQPATDSGAPSYSAQRACPNHGGRTGKGGCGGGISAVDGSGQERPHPPFESVP
jgi:hypothetical protein